MLPAESVKANDILAPVPGLVTFKCALRSTMPLCRHPKAVVFIENAEVLILPLEAVSNLIV